MIIFPSAYFGIPTVDICWSFYLVREKNKYMKLHFQESNSTSKIQIVRPCCSVLINILHRIPFFWNIHLLFSNDKYVIGKSYITRYRLKTSAIAKLWNQGHLQWLMSTNFISNDVMWWYKASTPITTFSLPQKHLWQYKCMCIWDI